MVSANFLETLPVCVGKYFADRGLLMPGVQVWYCRILLLIILGSIIITPDLAGEACLEDLGQYVRSVRMTECIPAWFISAPKCTPTAHMMHAQKTGGCKIEHRDFFSNECSTQMHYYAFIPSSSNNCKRYPVLFLLHGATGSYKDWKNHAQKELCDLVSKRQIIIITPEGNEFGWYANHIERYFFNELIPHVEGKLRTSGFKSIAGLSMGGHGAFVLCLRHHNKFVSVSSMSGILDITRHKNQWRLSEVFGPYSKNAPNWAEHSVLKLLGKPETQQYVRSLPMLITVSTGDQYSLRDNVLVHEELERLKISHKFRESPGGHDWTYWVSELPEHVEFHAAELEKARLKAEQGSHPCPGDAKCF